MYNSSLSHIWLHKKIIVEYGASWHGIGEVSMRWGNPLGFESFQIKGKNLLKPIYEKEMLVILHAIAKYNPYLIGRYFKLKIGHESFTYFLEQWLYSNEKQKWVTNMLSYDFEIIHKRENKM